MEIKTVGVVGAGQMGSGIAEVALTCGFHVLMRDMTEALLTEGRGRIEGDLERRVQKGKMAPEEKEATLKRLSTTTRLEDFGHCDYVIEAAVERIPLKGEIFKGLDEITPKGGHPGQQHLIDFDHANRLLYPKRPDRVIGIALLQSCARHEIDRDRPGTGHFGRNVSRSPRS